MPAVPYKIQQPASLSTITGNNQSQGKVSTYFARDVWGGWLSTLFVFVHQMSLTVSHCVTGLTLFLDILSITLSIVMAMVVMMMTKKCAQNRGLESIWLWVLALNLFPSRDERKWNNGSTVVNATVVAVAANAVVVFLKMGQSQHLYVYLRPFLITIQV